MFSTLQKWGLIVLGVISGLATIIATVFWGKNQKIKSDITKGQVEQQDKYIDGQDEAGREADEMVQNAETVDIPDDPSKRDTIH